ncbi:hypothetical protein R1flu_007913 [Riccia fluitans]|uniref:C-terminal of Roc (COR) domain-containing protein n=1 Tax=Riccia fluitans TaxID=41844 RepID=A0ABD1Z1E8_9MARC
MGDLPAHWWRLGQLTIGEALRESGLPDDSLKEFTKTLLELEDRQEVNLNDLEEFGKLCSALEGVEETRVTLEHISGTTGNSQYARQRVVNYWKCLFLAIVGRGPGATRLTNISLVRGSVEIILDEDEALALCVNLSSNSKIQSLHLRNQTVFGTKKVCDFLSRALKSNSTLRELSLSCTDLGSAAVQILMTGLENNIALEVLDLGGNGEIGNEGIAYIARMLGTNTSLKALNIEGVGFGMESARLICSAIGSNETLETFSIGNNPITAEGMKMLLALFTPKESSGAASWNTLITIMATGERELKNTTIKHLGLQEMKPLDVSVEFLASMLKANKSLISLDLSALPLDANDWVDKIIPALKVNDTLKHLVLDNCKSLPCEAFMELITSSSTKTALEEISLEGTNIASRAGAMHEELTINKLYRKRWRDEIRVKPRSARIVLCGFEFAGKSTICKTMRDNIHGTSCFDNWLLAFKRFVRKVPCIREILFGGQATRELDERTRGCEIVHLRDYDRQGTISVWDFAGLKEYYALHDYLFPSFKNSCFLYTCSVRFPPYPNAQTAGSQHRVPGGIKHRDDMREEFLYWMRFIAANSKRIPNADGQSGPLPRVILVLTNKDSLDFGSLNCSTRWAKDVVDEMRERFKDVVELQEEVEVIDAHSPEDVTHLFNVAGDSLEQLLELSTEYAVCEEVRLALQDWSDKKSKPVLNMTDFRKLCEKRLQPNMDPIEYRAAKLGTTEGQVEVLAYLDYIGEIIYTQSLNLIVVNPRWFGMGVLGSLIDAFRGVQGKNWRGLVGALENCLSPSDNAMRFHHRHGFVREEDFKEITKHLEQHVDPDTLVKLMIQLDLCFKVEVDEEEREVHEYTNGSDSLSMRTPLLGGFRGKRTNGDIKHKRSLLFIPALFDDDEDPEGMLKPEWSRILDTGEHHFQYIGRRLECEDKILTFLTPGFFPRLQVYLLNYLQSNGWTDNKGFRMDKNLIGFYHNGMDVLVEYSGDRDYFVDILVKSSHSFSDTLHFMEIHIISQIRDFCATPRGCQGVVLVEAVIRPVCVEYLFPCEQRTNQAELASHLEDRIKENGRGYQYAWREDIEGFSDLDFALDLLHGEGYLNRTMRMQIIDAVNLARSSVTRGSSGWLADLDKEEEAVRFPRLFYPTLENAGVMLTILANIDTEIPISIHLLCEDREGTHVVEDQAGRILQIKANSNSPILKYALSLIWFGVIRSATDAGQSLDSVDESWPEILFAASDVSACIEDLFRIMDSNKPLRAASVHDILDAYIRYLQIEPSTDWLLDFLFLDNRRDFWQDFQLWKVKYTDSNQTSWVCDQHFQAGTKWGKSMFHSIAI